MSVAQTLFQNFIILLTTAKHHREIMSCFVIDYISVFIEILKLIYMGLFSFSH